MYPDTQYMYCVSLTLSRGAWHGYYPAGYGIMIVSVSRQPKILQPSAHENGRAIAQWVASPAIEGLLVHRAFSPAILGHITASFAATS